MDSSWPTYACLGSRARGTSGASARRKRLGQHFLNQTGSIDRIMELIEPGPGERILEIGPGRGALTGPLLSSGARVLAVEIDPGLARNLRERLPSAGALRVLEADFLRLDALRALEEHLPPGEEIRVVGNLPYSVASPILLKLLALGSRFTDLTLMVQREVADRILSPPGNRSYGVLTLLCAYRASSRRLLDLPPACFTPRPEVHSTLLRLVPAPPPRTPPFDRFERIVKAAFSGRRKTLKNSLALGLGRPVPEVEMSIRAAGLKPGDRPETVDLRGFLELARRCHSAPRDQEDSPP